MKYEMVDGQLYLKLKVDAWAQSNHFEEFWTKWKVMCVSKGAVREVTNKLGD